MVRESESKATAGVEQRSGDGRRMVQTACFVYDMSTYLFDLIWGCSLLSVCWSVLQFGVWYSYVYLPVYAIGILGRTCQDVKLNKSPR